MSATASDLQAGFEILWYRIESVLGRGGFGITYLARDNNLGQLVAIKEYLPHEFAARGEDSTVQPVSVEKEDVYSWGLERFMSEAQTLAKFKHPNIVRVLSVFKHNNTGYMVMEYEEGEDLSDVYKRQKKLPQSELENIYYPIIDGLALVHKEGFIHRDIKPANIFIRNDGSPVLIDFGAARQAVGSKTKTLTSMLSIGYAPFEQYNDEPGKQGPWTDVYALGASLYQGISGKKPVESTLRGMALLHDEPDPYEPLSISGIEGYTQVFLRAIDQALMLQIHDRPQNLDDFLGMLKGEIVLPPLSTADEKVPDATVTRDRTVIRPRTDRFKGADIEDTHPEPPETRHATQAEKGTTDNLTPGKAEPASAKSAAAARKSPFARPILVAVTGVLVAIVVAVFVLFPGEPSPEELQRQKVNELLARADDLFASGRYQDASGNSALGTYRQVISIDPENAKARDGIDRVARHYLEQARDFIGNGKFAEADASLKVVNGIDPEYPGLKEMIASFSDNMNTAKKIRQIELLINKAETAVNQGNIYQPKQDNALLYYRNVLRLDPDNVTARLGLSTIADTLIDRAQSAIENDDQQNAEALVSLVESIDSDKPALERLRQQIEHRRDLDRILAKADSAFEKERYTLPKADNAYELYREALVLSPSNQHAQNRLDSIAEFYAQRTRRFTQSGSLTGATTNLDVLEKHFPDYAALSNLKFAISQKRSEINKQAEQEKQRKIEQAKIDDASPPVNRQLIPVGINQAQEDSQVVQDIIGSFIQSFKSRDMASLLKVSQLSQQQQVLYGKIFNLYQSMNIKVAPNGFSLNTNEGIARVDFEIVDLLDINGNSVVTSANWTRLSIQISKENGDWLKAAIM